MPSHIRKEETSRLLFQENAILHKEDPERARIDCKETFCLWSLVEGQRLMVTNQGPAENPLDSRQMRHWQKQFSGTTLSPNWGRSLFEMAMCYKI